MTTLGAAIAGALPYLQDQAASRRLDVGKFVRTGAPGKPDPVTGKVPRPETVIYEGAARIRPLTRVTNQSVEAGEAKDSQGIYIVGVAHDATGIEPGDVWVTTSSPDATVLALRLRVTEVPAAVDTTELRVVCVDVARRKP